MAYTTTHDTANRRMYHSFENGYNVMVDFVIKVAKVQLKDKTDSFSIEDIDIEDYHKILNKYDESKSN